jgi:glycosyltransferase involved in cell wall biosynthesis
MKKLLVIHNKYQIPGGEDSNIHDEISHLMNEYEVRYLEFNNIDKFRTFDILSLATRTNLIANRLLKKELNTFKPDAVYIHNTWFKANLGLFKILKKRNINTLFKIHNFRYDCSRFFLASNHLRGSKICNACFFRKKNRIFNKYYEDSYLKSLLLIFYSKKLFKIIKNYPLKVIVLTNFHKNYLSMLGVSKSKIFIYCNPITLNGNKFNTTKKNKYAVYAGRLTKEKGVESLLDSWISADIANFPLKIIGSGNLQSMLITKYKNSNVEFLGELSNEETLKQIKESSVVITATNMYEGQPRLLCEASSFGIPSIYPSFGGMDEFFPKDYPFSFKQYDYVDLKSKILELHNELKLKKISDNVYKKISSKLNPNELLNQFRDILTHE